jgi:hypothetical protein
MLVSHINLNKGSWWNENNAWREVLNASTMQTFRRLRFASQLDEMEKELEKEEVFIKVRSPTGFSALLPRFFTYLAHSIPSMFSVSVTNS